MPGALNDYQYSYFGSAVNPSSGIVASTNLNGVTAASTLLSIPANSQWFGTISINGLASVTAATSAAAATYSVVASSSTVIFGFSSTILSLQMNVTANTTATPGAVMGSICQPISLVTGPSSAQAWWVTAGGGASGTNSVTLSGVILPRSL